MSLAVTSIVIVVAIFVVLIAIYWMYLYIKNLKIKSGVAGKEDMYTKGN